MQQDTIQGYRLSPQQKQLWPLLRAEQTSPYVSWCLIEIDGLSLEDGPLRGLNRSLLLQALDHIVIQHEILRTSLRLLPGMTIPVQVIADGADVPPMFVTDHEMLAASGAEQPGNKRPELPALQADLLSAETLVLQAPAICADGPSMQILTRQLFAAYAALQRGEELGAIEAMQYADFAEWQNEMLESEEGAAGRRHWQRLDLRQAVTRRMAFERSVHGADFRSHWLTFEIAPEVVRAAEELGQRFSVSRPTVFLACWQILLAKSNGWNDVTSGVAFDGRKFDELKESVGLLSTFLPIDTQLTEDLSFAALLRQVADQLERASQFQEYFSWTQQSSTEEMPRFFPYCFEARTLPPSFVEAGLTFTIGHQESCISPFKLKFVCEQRHPETSAKLEYDPNLFSVSDVDLLGDRLSLIIDQAISKPEAAISDLDFLGPGERHLLLREFNDTERDLNSRFADRDPRIHKHFEEQVEQNPSWVALVFEDEQLTYEELNVRANQLAHHLRRLGVGPEVAVALALDRSLDLIVAILGILKSGGAYVPLDPGLPHARLAMMLNDARARVLIARSDLAAALREAVGQIVDLDADRQKVESESRENLVDLTADQNLAYVIFTSGSTGRPKGVAVEHRQLLNYVNAISAKLDLPTGSSFASVSTVAADLGNTVLFPPLCFGGTLHLISEERATNPDAFAAYFKRHAIDCLKIVPSHLAALLSAASPADVLPRKRLVLGGEASSWQLLDQIKTLAPGCRILNHYGPTEATVGAVSHEVDLGESSVTETVPLGTPLGNVQLFILDEQMRLALPGAPGELYIGGAGVARGYLNRPDITAERFVPNPFGAQDRLYRTGDRARYLSDGRVEFLGRTDDQVKIHGYRIEPREIDFALREHAAIKTSYVMAREDTPGDKRLVAYCVAQDGQSPAVNQLRTFLKGRLPEYMLPSAFVFLRQLPLTANGKIDRQALPVPDRFRHDGDGAPASPRNQIEETLVRLWSTVLGSERVGIHDNFFALGGDSILSIQIIARANQAGLRLSPRQLFQHQTIAELAAVAGTGPQVSAEQGLITGVVPLLPVQARFLAQQQPAPHHYNQAKLVKVADSLAAEVIEQAIKQLLRHHDALRLRFTATPNGWTQRIDGETNQQLEQIDLTQLSATEQSASFAQHAEALQSSLNLQAGPLLRFTLFDFGQQHRLLLIVIHHLAVDGVSWGVLLEDLETLCTAVRGNEALPPKTTSFKTWAELLHSHSQSEALRLEVDQWLSLQERPCGLLPVDGQGENNAASARTVTVALAEDETLALLQEVPGAFRTQINEILLTALARTLSAWTGSRRVLLDLEGHGREDVFPGVDLSRTVGWFTTIFPVVLDLSAAPEAVDALRLVKEQLRALPGRGLGYGLLRYGAANQQIGIALAALPQAQIRFNYLGQLDRTPGAAASLFRPAAEAGESSALSIGPLQSGSNSRGYLLNIIASVTGGALHLEWTYSENCHGRSTIEKLAANYLEELRVLIAYSRKAGAQSLSPADFPSAGLSQDDLNKVLAQLGKSK